MLGTEGSAKLIGLEVGVLVHPIEQLSGTFSNADSILVKAVDQLSALSSGGAGNIAIFVADTDTMIIGSAAKFEELEFILDTVASGAGIKPTFAFSNGGGFTAFTPTDGTNAMRNTGVIAWLDGDIPTWAIDGNSEFTIKITRTRSTLTTNPIADKVQIAAATEFFWNKDGDLVINSLASAVAIPVSSGGTGLAIGTSGGILAFTGSTTLTSSAALADNVLVVGGGAGAVPNTISDGLGSATTVLHGGGAAEPSFSAVSLTADISGILPIANGGTNNNSWTSGSVPFFDGTRLEEDNSNHVWSTANLQLLLGRNTVSVQHTAAAHSLVVEDGIGISSEGGSAALRQVSYGDVSGSQISLRRSNGTEADPATNGELDDDNVIGFIAAAGHDSANFRSTGLIRFVADEAWSSGVGGTRMEFQTAPLGSVTPAVRLQIAADGEVLIGTTAVTAGVQLDVAGGDIRTNNQLVSTIAIGTPPLIVTSTTVVPNLNVDRLDDLEATAFALLAGRTGTTNDLIVSSDAAGTITGSGAASADLHLRGTDNNLLGEVVIDSRLQLLPNLTSPVSASVDLITFDPTFEIDTAITLQAFVFTPAITVSTAGAVAIRGVTGAPTITHTDSNSSSAFTLFTGTPIVQSATASKPPMTTTIFNAAPSAGVTGAVNIGTIAALTILSDLTLLNSVAGGTMTLTDQRTVHSRPVFFASGTTNVTTRTALRIEDIVRVEIGGTLNVTNNFGMDVADLDEGDTLNVALRSAVSTGTGSWHILATGDADSSHRGNLSVGGASLVPAATLHAVQDSLTGAKPCLELDQNDVSEEFIEFDGTETSNLLSSLSDFTTPNTAKGMIKVTINGSDRWLAHYDAPTA